MKNMSHDWVVLPLPKPDTGLKPLPKFLKAISGKSGGKDK